MMRQLKDKKIFLYIIVFVILGSINNQSMTNLELFKVKNINLQGLEVLQKENLLNNLDNLKNKNIFKINNNEIKELIFQNNLVEYISIFKKYPSTLDIKIQKTKFLANMNMNGDYFLIGTNKKLIQTDFIDKKLPMIFGKPSIENFFELKDILDEAKINLSIIKRFYYYHSSRWDLEFNNGDTIKLPINNIKEALRIYFLIHDLEKFNNIDVFDFRVNKQLIVNEFKK